MHARDRGGRGTLRRPVGSGASRRPAERTYPSAKGVAAGRERESSAVGYRQPVPDRGERGHACAAEAVHATYTPGRGKSNGVALA